jgi:hypothetical protein
MSEYNEEFIENLFWGDEYEEVTTKEISDQSRWSTFYYQVFKKKADGTFWAASWSRGSTEYQDNGVESFELHEVVPEEVKQIVYVPKKQPEASSPPPAPSIPPLDPANKE